MYICIYRERCIFLCIHIYAFISKYISMGAYIHTYVFIYMHIHVCMCVCIYIYIYIDMYI